MRAWLPAIGPSLNIQHLIKLFKNKKWTKLNLTQIKALVALKLKIWSLTTMICSKIFWTKGMTKKPH